MKNTLGNMVMNNILSCKSSLPEPNHQRHQSRTFSRKSEILLLLFLLLFFVYPLMVFAEPCPVVGNSSDLEGSGPDLQLELVTIQPRPGVSDSLTSVDALVKNLGDQPVVSSFSIVLCVDNVIVNSKSWDPIPNEREEFTAGTSIPFYSYLNLSSGSHTLRWIVDAGDTIAETAEQNNILELNENWISNSDAPDLVVQKVFTRLPTVKDNGEVGESSMANYLIANKESEITVRIANVGKSATKENVTIRITSPFEKDQNLQIAYFTLNGLAARAHQDLAFIVPGFKAKAVKKFDVIVDVGNTIAEANEENNSLSKSFEVRYANLVIKKLRVSPIKVALKKEVSIDFQIYNKGNDGVPTETLVRVQPGKNEQNNTLSPIFLKVPALGPGQKVQLSHKYEPTTLTSYDVELEVNPPEQRKWPEQLSSQQGKTAFSQFSVVEIGPKINRFESTVINGEYARLDWEVLCEPACSVELDHLYYTNSWKVALKGSREVKRDRNKHDGTYKLTAKRGSKKVNKEVKVPKYVSSDESIPKQKLFYVKLTNPSSFARPCFAIPIYGANEKEAKKKAEAENPGYTAKIITAQQYDSGKACIE